MFKWKRLSTVKIFESKASLKSLMPKHVDELGIPGLLSTLFSLSIRSFSLPKFLFVVAESLVFSLGLYGEIHYCLVSKKEIDLYSIHYKTIEYCPFLITHMFGNLSFCILCVPKCHKCHIGLPCGYWLQLLCIFYKETWPFIKWVW